MNKIGQEIQKIRIQKNMTAKQLAKKIGVSEKYILDVESSKIIIKDHVLRKIEKALGQDVESNQFSIARSETEIYETMEDLLAGETNYKPKSKKNANTTKESHVWETAFGNAFAELPVYDYSLKTLLSTRRLPIIDNRVEGFNKERLFYIQVNDLEMKGLRLHKNDYALVERTKTFNKNGIYFVEFKGQRMIRKLKYADQSNYYLISHPNTLRQIKVQQKEVNILGRLFKIEFYLGN